MAEFEACRTHLLYATAGDDGEATKRALQMINGIVLKGILLQDAMPHLSGIKAPDKIVVSVHVKLNGTYQTWKLSDIDQDTWPLNLLGAPLLVAPQRAQPWTIGDLTHDQCDAWVYL